MNRDTFAFLNELVCNNNREWFEANKHRYIAIKDDFEASISKLIATVSLFDEEMRCVSAKQCTYRIYKDMRFSKDKLPYKTNMGAFMTKFGKKLERAGYYLHIEPGKSMLCAGLWFPQPPLLKADRRAIYENIDEFMEIITEPKFVECFGGLDYEDSLKKLPLGFDKDFEHPELLKLKNLGVVKYLDDNFFNNSDWVEQIAQFLSYTKPLKDFLNYTIDNRE